MNKHTYLFFSFLFYFITCFTQRLQASSEEIVSFNNQTFKYIDSLLKIADNIDNGPILMLSLSEHALKLSENSGYTYGKMHSTYNIARAYFYQSKLQMSYQILDSLITQIEADSNAIKKITNYSRTRSKIYTLIAVIFQDLNVYKTSMQYYLKALNLMDKNGSDFDIGLIYKGLGGLNLKSGNQIKAEEYFEKAIEVGNKAGDQKIRFDILHLQYNHFVSNKYYSQALETGMKLLGIAKISKNAYMKAIALKNLGEIYFLIEEPKIAEAYLKSVTDSLSSEQFPNVLSECYTLLACINNRLGYYSEAGNYAEKAVHFSERTSILTLKSKALLELANSLEARGMHEQANQNLKKYFIYNDSLYKSESATQVLLLQSKADLDNVLNAKALVENQLKIQTLESSRKTFLLLGSALLIIFMCGLTLILIKKYKYEMEVNKALECQQEKIREQRLIIQQEKEAQLQMQLEHKNRELITRAMALTKIQEEKIRLIEKLKEISSKLNKSNNENASLIESQVRYMQNNIDVDIWSDFKVYFENVYSDFYKNLLEAHPNLSMNEKKLCALIVLNLSTKEIAEINSREVRSIESARNRLRKKLELSPNINLADYLSQF